ncbi:hypothetical protein [Rhodopirellula europaea]|jgi:hypothetical protein|uniref:Uncharacterized protein n=1 Tax=Rhodopirellula europaea SH398 TaxID=1263868 RepID=M5ST01_9BACT|nr:hypothetical protein [Rhodopirellula europaea]EMI29399.1 hypothetical protein RESH_00119 [Rhodopirellula europaea SH398]
MPREENPNELEAFLRKSAEIRQRNAIEFRALQEEQRRQDSNSRPRQYSDRNRERVTRQLAEAIDVSIVDDHGGDEVVMGEVVEERLGSLQHLDVGTNESDRKSSGSKSRGRVATPVDNLRRLLSRPGGAQQAFLMSEILKRRSF